MASDKGEAGNVPAAGGQGAPIALDIKKDRGLTVQWSDGSTAYYSVEYLRRMSPSAEARQLREELSTNPLTVLPQKAVNTTGRPLAIETAEMVGHYALRIRFSDGHDTGLYSWAYLREIEPRRG